MVKQLLASGLEEEVGFEPTKPGVSRFAGFQDQRHQPLAHSSNYLLVWLTGFEPVSLA